MANLLGSSIEPNYRGILNLGDTINQPLSGTLQSVTDGMGNNSPLSLSTTVVGIGRTGADGLVHWRRSADGNSAATTGVRPGFSDWYFEGNNVNFRTNSTGFFFGGGSTWVTPTARLHVKGDGANPVARFESSTNINIVSVRQSDFSLIFGAGVADSFAQIGLQTLNSATTMNTSGNGQYLAYRANFNKDWPGFMHSFFGSNHDYSTATASNNPAGIAFYNGTFGISSVAASTFDYRMIAINYTINNTAVSNRTATGIFLNATETNLNGMTHNLMDLQVQGVGTRFSVSNGGWIKASSFLSISNQNVNFTSYSNGQLTLFDNTFASFNRINFGGNTNLFPAIKRNSVGLGLQIRRADDSGYSDLEASTYLAAAGIIYMNTSGNVFIIRGTGSPEGVQAASVGALYMRTDGGANTTLYVKESGTGNTGWVAK